jgi:hypothetical protein
MKKKQAVKSTIVIPPTRKNEPNTVTKPAKSKLTPISEAQASAPNASIGFHWTELDIPFECPSSDCTHAVPPDPVFDSPPRVSMESSWSPHSPHGVLMESMESMETPHGVLIESS